MSVSKMKKLTMVLMKQDAGRIMRRLMWLGVVEVEKLSGSDEIISERMTQFEAEKATSVSDAAELEAAISAVSKYGEVRSGLFSPPPTVSREDFDAGIIGDLTYSELLEKAREINFTVKELDNLNEEYGSLKGQMTSLLPWLQYDMRLSDNSTALTKTVLGTFPKSVSDEKLRLADPEDTISAVTDEVWTDKNVRYVSVTYLADTEEETLRFLSKNGFTRLEFPGHTGTPAGEITKIRERIEELESDTESLRLRIADGAKNCDGFKIALDMANTGTGIADAKERLMCTERTVILSGWIPAEYTKELDAELARETVYYEYGEPEEGDDVPVHLVNSKPAGYFESVVSMYSLPAYGTFDPTRIMMVFFFIIFGMMLADVVYGLILSLGCLFIIKKARVSRGVKNMCAMFGVCGISCIIWGVIFGSYLGDFPQQFMKSMFGVDISIWKAMDIVAQSMTFIVMALAVGAVHMLTGMGIRFYVLCKNGQVFSAIFDEGSWFVVFAGIGLYFLNSTAGIIVACTGVGMLILTQGRHEKNIFMKFIKGIGSLYGLINYMADLISYSRIMALGLASAIIANVFNTIAVMGGPTIFGVLMFVLVILLGHALNLAINILGTFVHTSRLQFIEFFGKFYEDGGRPFVPVSPDVTNSEIVNEKTQKLKTQI